VSHISDVAEYYDEKSLLKEEWAILQVKTSVDYAHGSWLWTYLSGALNYQVVHHLFPGVSQYHYPKIAPIVMEVCKKHGLRYNVLPDFNEAISSHLRHLANMGA
jgi:fatty acid desaturase